MNPWQCWPCWPKICRCNSMNVETKKYLASIGAKGGKAKTAAKSAAAIANGKLGGRPKSKKRVVWRHND